MPDGAGRPALVVGRASGCTRDGAPRVRAITTQAMNLDIALLLAQDGITNGAIYALLALALVLVFAVTRVIFMPQGEFVAYGALTLVRLQLGQAAGHRVAAAGGRRRWSSLLEIVMALRARRTPRLARRAAWNLAFPLAMWALLASVLSRSRCRWPCRSLLALALVVPLGPMLYRLAFQPLAEASVLVLLIVSVAVHFALIGLGLLFFGAEGSRTPPFSDGSIERRRADRERADALGDRLLGRADRRALPLLRAHGVRQGAARHRGEPPRRAAGGHPDRRSRAACRSSCAR